MHVCIMQLLFPVRVPTKIAAYKLVTKGWISTWFHIPYATNSVKIEWRRLSSVAVTEREIIQGVLTAKEPTKNCIWFNRQINNIHTQTPNEYLSRYHGKIRVPWPGFTILWG